MNERISVLQDRLGIYGDDRTAQRLYVSGSPHRPSYFAMPQTSILPSVSITFHATSRSGEPLQLELEHLVRTVAFRKSLVTMDWHYITSLPDPTRAHVRMGAKKERLGYLSILNRALLVAKLRFTFLQKGGHAFGLVFGCKERMEHAAFEKQTFAQRGFVGAIDRFFDDHDRYHRFF